MNFRLIPLILINFCFNSGILSQLSQNSIYFSLNNYTDKIEYENSDNELIDITSKMYKANIGYVHKGRYEFALNYIENNSNVNNYYFYDSNSYFGFDFFYYFDSFAKFPIDLKIGANYINSDIYSSNSYIVYLYKELAGGGNYPVLPFVKFSNTEYSASDNSFKGSFPSLSVGMHLKLNVNSNDNNLLKDIIWLSTHVNTTNQSHYFIGFDIGLYHPIK